MNYITEYESETGRIVASHSGQGVMWVTKKPLISWVRANSDIYYDYVLHGEVVPRPVNPASLVDGVLRGVLAGSEVVIDSIVYVADGTDISLEFGSVGTYLITIECWPFLTWEKSYEVTA